MAAVVQDDEVSLLKKERFKIWSEAKRMRALQSGLSKTAPGGGESPFAQGEKAISEKDAEVAEIERQISVSDFCRG
jgi:hypothetical protein